MAGFVAGLDRGQATLLPECLEDWVDENNSVRAVDVFVEALDLRDIGFEGVDAAGIGRPAYHPSPMLKLYIYGYLNRVQSSRRLEREAGRNLEVMWLTGRLAPDHKTIADFRKDNGSAIKKVCARFVELCRKMGLLAKASVAIDGSKFKAVNSRDNNFTQGKIQRRQKQIEESVARYMSQLDTADRQTAAGEEPSETVLLTKTRLKEKLAKLEEEVKRLAAIEKALLASPDKQISLTDPDCRSASKPKPKSRRSRSHSRLRRWRCSLRCRASWSALMPMAIPSIASTCSRGTVARRAVGFRKLMTNSTSLHRCRSGGSTISGARLRPGWPRSACPCSSATSA